MSSKFGQIQSGTTELAALEHLKKLMLPLFLVSQLWLYLGNSQVSIYRTTGPLVSEKRKKKKQHITINFTYQVTPNLHLHVDVTYMYITHKSCTQCTCIVYMYSKHGGNLGKASK